MRITLNGNAIEIDAQTLDQALEQLGYADSVVATALNGTFIPKTQRRETRLGEGDRIEIVAPMQGG
jgi:sulfur carrier protein